MRCVVVEDAAVLVEDAAEIEGEGVDVQEAVIEVVGAAAAQVIGQGQGAAGGVGAARLGKNGPGADIADDLIGGVQVPAGQESWCCPRRSARAIQGQGLARGDGERGGGVLQQAVAGGEAGVAAGVEVGGAVVQQPPAENGRWSS